MGREIDKRVVHKTTPRAWVTLVACIVESFLFAGSIFGWPSMAYILQQDGIFIQNCPNDTLQVKEIQSQENVTQIPLQITDSGCDSQRSSIALAFTFATIVLGLMTFPNGMIFDKYGLRVTRCLATAIAVSGHLMLAFSAPHRLSYLIYPGSICVGVSCSIYIMICFHICLLAGPRSSTMSAIMAGAVNSGAATFLIIKLLYGIGFARRYGLMCLSGLYIYSLLITFFLLPAKKVYKKIKPVETEMISPQKVESADTFVQKSPLLTEKNGEPDKSTAEKNVTKSKSNDLKVILTSSYYLLHLYWFAVVHLRVTFFCSSFNSWAEHLTKSDEKVSLLTNAYGYIQSCSVIICPIAGILVDYFRKKIVKGKNKDLSPELINTDLARAVVPPLAIASLAAVSLCLCTLMNTTAAVWASCFLVELTRAFLYVTMGTYTSLTFPANRFGILFGITYAAGGLTTGLQYGLLRWSVAWQNFFYPNLVLLLAILLTFTHPANIYIRHLWSKRSRSV